MPQCQALTKNKKSQCKLQSAKDLQFCYLHQNLQEGAGLSSFLKKRKEDKEKQQFELENQKGQFYVRVFETLETIHQKLKYGFSYLSKKNMTTINIEDYQRSYDRFLRYSNVDKVTQLDTNIKALVIEPLDFSKEKSLSRSQKLAIIEGLIAIIDDPKIANFIRDRAKIIFR